MKGLARLGALWNSVQSWLLPALEDELGEKRRLFVAVCETCAPGARMGACEWLGNGRPSRRRGTAFAEDGLVQRVHEAMLLERYADKIAGHVSRDPVQRDRSPREVRQEEAGKSQRGGAA